MEKTKLQTLKGFRDFLPKDALKRQYLKNIFIETFELFGFEPIETPTIEYEDLLLGKYGEETDKLVFKFADEGGRKVALRYDQTVPTSRVLAMYEQKLPMPWRRFQIQTAYRAEKPQKGRFREFTQCDIDIYGSTSPLSDAEVLAVGNALLKKLGFSKFKILINDRNILFNIMKETGIPDKSQLSVIQSIDKLDKKSKSEVENELAQKGIKKEIIDKLFKVFDASSPTELLKKTIDYTTILGVAEKNIEFTPRLARGLDYYNSIIYEFIIEGYPAGSVAGGGRYDNLIKQLSGIDIPATGYSWGFDRIIEAMEQFKLFPQENKRRGTLITVFSSELIKDSIVLAANLRENHITAEIYPDENTRLDKQLKYADKKGIKWLIVIGPDEVNKNMVVLKDLETGHQEDIKLENLIKKINN